MEGKNKTVNLKKITQETIEELLRLLGIEADFKVSSGSPAANKEEGVEVVLETKDSGIIIGYHGEVLEALQLIFSLCISKKVGRFVRVSLEVGDYKKNRTGYLENLALQAKEKARLEKTDVSLQGLKSWERRIVHVLLQDDEDVVSESVGEGKDRTLVIKPRT